MEGRARHGLKNATNYDLKVPTTIHDSNTLFG